MRVSAWDPAGATVVGVTAVLPTVGARTVEWIQVPLVPTTHRSVPGRRSRSTPTTGWPRRVRRTTRLRRRSRWWSATASSPPSPPIERPTALTRRSPCPRGLANPGRPFTGTVRTTVEDEAGSRLALLDERPAALEYGQSTSWKCSGTPPRRGRVATPFASASRRPAMRRRARARSARSTSWAISRSGRGLAAQPARVGVAEAVRFTPVIENLARNRALAGGSARLTVVAEARERAGGVRVPA